MAPVLPLLAQSAVAEAGPWLTVINLGLAGIGLWAFGKGHIRRGSECDAAVARAEAAEERERQRNKEDRETLIPLLTRVTDTLARQIERRLGDTPPPPNKPVRES